jgi:single-stranded DNA-binding protein
MQSAKITLVNATLGRDPERKQTRTGTSLTSFSVAVNHKQGGDEFVNWYAVTAFGKLGETLMDLASRGAFGKGSRVVITGRFAARPYQANGTERTSLDVTADDVILVGGGASNDTTSGDMEGVPW